MNKLLSRLLVAIAVFGSTRLFADELLMNDGSRIIGKLVSAEAGKIVFKTDFAGDLSVDSLKVDTLFTDAAVTVKMKDGRLFENKTIAAQDRSMLLMNDALEAVRFEVDDIDRLNPEPWELGDGYGWSGKVGASALLEKGNTDTEELV